MWTCVYQIKRYTPKDAIVEINFYCHKRTGRKDMVDNVDRAIPRVEAFDPAISVLQAKR